MQAVDVDAVADHLQQAKLFLLNGAIGGGNVAGQGIGRGAQISWQRISDDVDDGFNAVFLAEDFCTVGGNLGQ